MNIKEIQQLLTSRPNSSLYLNLPNGDLIPAHYHITEVGRVQKDFIDCGGTRRSTTACVLQAWVAKDTEHRLETGKLARIIDMAAPLLEDRDLPVEIEYEDDLVSQFPISYAEFKPDGLHLYLTTKHTDCLARERCGVAVVSHENDNTSCCTTSGCC